jgi:hypothetical protein
MKPVDTVDTVETVDNSAGRTPPALLRDAADPATPPARLRRILDIADRNGAGDGLGTPRRALLETLAANPNCPPDVLARLTTLVPERALANPALPLAALEAPDFAQGVEEERARELMRAAGTSPLVLALLANDASRPWLAEEARLHVGLAGEAPPDGWEDEVRAFWSGYANGLPVWTECEALLDLAAVGMRAPLWEPAATWPLFASRHARTYRVALNPETPRRRLEALARRAVRIRSAALRVALAVNPSTPEAVRARLPRRFSGVTLVPTADTKAAHALCREALRRGAHSRSSEGMPLLTYVLLADTAPPAVTVRHRRAALADDWRLRLAAALTLPPGVPAGARLRALLAGDGNRLVRAAAASSVSAL